MKDDADTPLFEWAVALCIAVVLILVAIGFAVPAILGRPSGPGIFGDMFGVANALFSGLAFVGVIIAILLQSKELALQRDELRETRQEMAHARAESARSARATEIAARLSALSQLIAYHKAEMEKYKESAFETFPDANAPYGRGTAVIDERAADSFNSHRITLEQLLRELDQVYNELQTAAIPAA